MKIVFVNRYFFPDHSATSQMLTDLAGSLVERGFEVEVVTSRQRYDDPSAQLADRQDLNGILVHRVRTTRFGRGSLLGRLLDYLSFHWSAYARLLRVLAPGDCVVAKTDPPLLAVPAALAARAREADLINWLQDIFPETAQELGILPRHGPATGMLLGLRDWALRRARLNVVVGEHMRRYCAARGCSQERLRTIPNWADEGAIRPLAPRDNPLRARWGLGGAFVVGYSGNLGRAHEFETICGAAARLRPYRDLVFLFVGAGAGMDALRQTAATRGLSNLRFEPYQPRSDLAISQTAPDVHLVILRPALERLMLPSKFYSAAAAGRPILFIGDPEGELARLIRDARAGWTVAPGDADGLAALVLRLRNQQEYCREVGTNARQLLEREFGAEHSLTAWATLLAPWKGQTVERAVTRPSGLEVKASTGRGAAAR